MAQLSQVGFVLLPLLHLTKATNYDYNYDDYYDEPPPLYEDTSCDNCPDLNPELTPVKIQFLVEPLTLTVNEGDVIRLPCLVDQFDQFPLLWKKDSNVLSIGDKVMNFRVNLERVNNGIILHFPPATLGDEGEYTCTPVPATCQPLDLSTCQLSTSGSPKELVHRVKVKAIPRRVRPGNSGFDHGDQVHHGEVRTTSTASGLAALHSALQNTAPLLTLLVSNCLSFVIAMATG